MRRLAVLLCFSLASPIVAQTPKIAQTPRAPAFEFRGHVLGQPFIGETACGYEGPDECNQYGLGINGAAVKAIIP